MTLAASKQLQLLDCVAEAFGGVITSWVRLLPNEGYLARSAYTSCELTQLPIPSQSPQLPFCDQDERPAICHPSEWHPLPSPKRSCKSNFLNSSPHRAHTLPLSTAHSQIKTATPLETHWAAVGCRGTRKPIRMRLCPLEWCVCVSVRSNQHKQPRGNCAL